MENKKVLNIILSFIAAFLFIAAGALTIIFCSVRNFTYENMMLGIILITVSCVKIINYLFKCGYKNPNNLTLALSTASLVLGIIFLVNKVEITVLCFVWGFYEITSSCVEIYIAANEIKHNRLAIMEVAIEIATIVFGILLCIKLEHGLTGHLLFLTISMFLYAILVLLEIAPELSKKKKENE